MKRLLPALVAFIATFISSFAATPVAALTNTTPLTQTAQRKASLVTLNKAAVAFQARSGASIIHNKVKRRGWGDLLDNQILMSDDGKTYYEVFETGYGGNLDNEYDLDFDDPSRGRSGEFHRLNNTVTYKGATYQKVKTPKQVSVIPLLNPRHCEYLFATPDGKYVYVSTNKYYDMYDTWRLYVGSGSGLRYVPVKRVERYRDGGTTFVETSESTLYSPTSFWHPGNNNVGGKDPLWGKIRLTRLDPDKYTITETPAKVTIAVKK